MFLNFRSVLSQCNTQLGLAHLLYDIDFTHVKQTRRKHAFSLFYTLIIKRFLTNGRACIGSYLYYNQ